MCCMLCTLCMSRIPYTAAESLCTLSKLMLNSIALPCSPLSLYTPLTLWPPRSLPPPPGIIGGETFLGPRLSLFGRFNPIFRIILSLGRRLPISYIFNRQMSLCALCSSTAALIDLMNMNDRLISLTYLKCSNMYNGDVMSMTICIRNKNTFNVMALSG